MNVQATTKPASTTKNATTTTTTSGTTGLYFSKNSVTVGDSVKATITGSKSDTIKVRFTTSVLTLTNCTATGYTLSGNAVTLFFKHLWRDIKVAIKSKPSIIFGLLVMLTGFIFGFTINNFIKLAYNFTAEYAYVGLLIFIYELAGVFNMVNGFGMCTSRRLKSVVGATIATVLMLITGILWIYATGHYLTGSENLELVPLTSSIIIVSLITSIIGVVGGYFTYDREALKVRR
jgi:hypothetical protein